jgi:hypothetical protein
MLPTEPLKIDLMRLAVVLSLAGELPTQEAGFVSYP